MDAAVLPKLDLGGALLTEKASVISDVLKLALKVVCDREGIAPRIVANSSDLDAVAMDDEADVPLLRGWRRKLFGEIALRIKAGELAIVLEGGKPRILPYPAGLPEVKAAVAARDVGSLVTFRGFISEQELIAALQSADVAVMPSTHTHMLQPV